MTPLLPPPSFLYVSTIIAVIITIVAAIHACAGMNHKPKLNYLLKRVRNASQLVRTPDACCKQMQ